MDVPVWSVNKLSRGEFAWEKQRKFDEKYLDIKRHPRYFLCEELDTPLRGDEAGGAYD